ncbi:Short-chain dehydrogenase/reductase SDR [Fusarium sp. Ph1]|nr:Short-chain dehydrogenase/reductase SDR [Fusarium sp. Ph1]
MTIYGKTVLVTAGTLGLDNNIARACAEPGAQRIILFDTDQELVKEYGAPDILLHAAGIADSNLKAETYNPTIFQRVIDINLNGSFLVLVSQATSRAMIAAGKPGSIVLVASTSGVIVNYAQEQSWYNASKYVVIQVAKSLAVKWVKLNVRVNSISSRKKIWLPLTSQNRLRNVRKLNDHYVFLATDASQLHDGV